jgi:hypothetical protein
MIIGQWVKVGPFWAYTDGNIWTCEADLGTQRSLERMASSDQIVGYSPSFVSSMVQMAIDRMAATAGKTVDDGVPDQESGNVVF